MIFDKEFVMYLAQYVGENNQNAKKYLNAYNFKFLDILNDDLLKKNKQSIYAAYRFWNFKDLDILNFIFGKKIPIYKSGFLSYFSNIGNTKFMIEFLEIDNPRKLFYLIEEQNDEFLRIYTPLENINEDEYSSNDLDYINEVLEKYKDENEYVRLKIDAYDLNYENTKAILIHEWLGDLLELESSHKLNNGYYYIILSKENILFLRNNDFFKLLKNEENTINSIGCSVFDEFYDISYVNYYNNKINKKKPKEKKEEDYTKVTLIKFEAKE